MRIVLDTSILARSHKNSSGPARKLLLQLINSSHILITSQAILHELAKVLRYPRLKALHRLSEAEIYRYILFMQHSSHLVRTDPLIPTPVRDINDAVIMQTAILGNADTLCTNDQDFFEPPARPYLAHFGIEVCDDLTLLKRIQNQPRL